MHRVHRDFHNFTSFLKRFRQKRSRLIKRCKNKKIYIKAKLDHPFKQVGIKRYTFMLISKGSTCSTSEGKKLPKKVSRKAEINETFA
jgi:hypothetical protein